MVVMENGADTERASGGFDLFSPKLCWHKIGVQKTDVKVFL
jgi:hypothetical protein